MRFALGALIGIVLALAVNVGSASAYFCGWRSGEAKPVELQDDPQYRRMYDEVLKAYNVNSGEAHRITPKVPDPAVDFAVKYESYLKVYQRLPGLESLAKDLNTALWNAKGQLAAAGGSPFPLNQNDVRAMEDTARRLEAQVSEISRLKSGIPDDYKKICPGGPVTSTAVLAMDGPPKPQQKFGGFKTVEAGKIYLEDPAYTVTATWDAIPTSLNHEGKTITLTIAATTKSNMATGIQIRAEGMETKLLKGDGVDKGHGQFDLPLNIAAPATNGSKSMTIYVKPNPRYATTDKPWISVGVFYGLKVEYMFKVVSTGDK